MREVFVYILITCAISIFPSVSKSQIQTEESIEYEFSEDDFLPERYIPVLREAPEDFKEGYKKDKEFKYASDPDFWEQYKQKTQDKKPASAVNKIDWGILKSIALVIIGILVVVLIFMLLNNSFLRKNNAVQQHTVSGLDDENDLTNLDDKLQKAEAENNFREAVRILYLINLKDLNEGEYIEFHEKFTNEDYKKQLSSSSLSSEFNQLSKIYEYVWYGEISVSVEQYKNIQTYFKNFNSKI